MVCIRNCCNKNKRQRLLKLRQLAHNVFDKLWQSQTMSRWQAYGWLSREMGLRRCDCHIKFFNEHKCYETIRICSNIKYEVISIKG
jgi:hypothetical protein